MAYLASHHVRRQQDIVNDDPNSPDYCPYWYCDTTAIIIKWVVVGALFLFFLIFIIGGYTHAKRRMQRGEAPLRYHRWLISRQARERFFPAPQNSASFYRPGPGQPQEYAMNNYGYAAPPPAYHEGEHVPAYTPPTKVNPDQTYAPPAGAPPPRNAPSSTTLEVPGPSQPPRAASPARNDK